MSAITETLFEELKLIDGEVSDFGCASFLENDSCGLNISALASVTSKLYQEVMTLRVHSNILENKLHAADGQLRTACQSEKSLSRRISQLETEVTLCQKSEHEAKDKAADLEKSLKSRTAELAKLDTKSRRLIAQYSHQLKRLSVELVKLKEQLHLTLKNKTKDSVIELNSGVPRSYRIQNRHWKNSAYDAEKEMMSRTITMYRGERDRVVSETVLLKQLLGDVEKELSEMGGREGPTRPSGAALKTHDIDFCHVPASTGQLLIQPKLKAALDQIRGKIGAVQNLMEDTSTGDADWIVRNADDSGFVKDSVTTPYDSADSPLAIRHMSIHDTSSSLSATTNANLSCLSTYAPTNTSQQTVPSADVSQQTVPSGVMSLRRLPSAITDDSDNCAQRARLTEGAVKLAQERRKFEQQRTQFMMQQFLRTAPS